MMGTRPVSVVGTPVGGPAQVGMYRNPLVAVVASAADPHMTLLLASTARPLLEVLPLTENVFATATAPEALIAAMVAVPLKLQVVKPVSPPVPVNDVQLTICS